MKGVAWQTKYNGHHWIIAVKLVFTVIVLGALTYSIDPGAILDRLRIMRPLYGVAAIVVGVFQILLVGIRWRVIVDAIRSPKDSVANTKHIPAGQLGCDRRGPSHAVDSR